MDKGAIEIGRAYAYRQKPRAGEPIERVRILRHVRASKWEVEWLDGENAGLRDFVASRQLVFPWSGRTKYLRAEELRSRFDEYNRPQYEALGTPIERAIEQTIEAAGEPSLMFFGGHLWGKQDAFERFVARAGRDPKKEIERALYSYVDQLGDMHVAAEQAHELARAFTMAEPRTVLDNVAATEIKWSRDVKEPGNDYLLPLLNEYRASWAILRQWAGHDVVVAELQDRVDRAERITLDALYVLQKAGLDREAERLRRKLGRS